MFRVFLNVGPADSAGCMVAGLFFFYANRIKIVFIKL